MTNLPSPESVAQVLSILRTMRKMKSEMADLRCQLAQLDKDKRLTKARMEGMRSQKEAIEPDCAKMFEKMQEIWQKQFMHIEKRVLHLEETEHRFLYLIRELDEMQSRIILLRWVEAKQWIVISRRVYMSTRSCQRFQKAAITRMALTLETMRQGFSMRTS